jgi:hypothetical protein
MEAVTSALALGLSFENNSLTFNTGVQPITWNGQSYVVNGDVALTTSFGLSYSLVTGGDTYAATESLTPQMVLNLNFPSAINLSQYPSDIGLNAPTLSFGGVDIGVVDFTAANGFQENLTAVPEPSTTALLGMGMVAGCFCSWRRRHEC